MSEIVKIEDRTGSERTCDMEVMKFSSLGLGILHDLGNNRIIEIGLLLANHHRVIIMEQVRRNCDMGFFPRMRATLNKLHLYNNLVLFMVGGEMINLALIFEGLFLFTSQMCRN